MSENNPKLLSMFGQAASIFAVALPKVIEFHPNIIALSADMSTAAGLDKFKATHPENFYNLGIAEQNMIGVAAGLSVEGFLPVCTAQACFLSMRDFEQIRQYCGYMQKRMILVGLLAGFSLSFFGKTHFALEDIALMRTIPGMTILSPCDALEAKKAFETALEMDGPVYIRLFGGTGVPVVYENDFDFNVGKTSELRAGSDVQIIATGSMVSSALKVADLLKEKSISASVIDMYTLKPLDKNVISSDAKLIVTIEEHNIVGGLGSAIAEELSTRTQHPALLRFGVKDFNFKIGDYNYLLEENGLMPEQIANKILQSI